MLGYSWTAISFGGSGLASTLTNSTTPTSLMPATTNSSKYTLPANFLQTMTVIRVRAAGRISTLVTSPGTLTLDIRFGSVIVATSPAFALNIVAQTQTTWILNWELTCQAPGASTSAVMFHTGMWTSAAAIGGVAQSVGGAASMMIPATSPAAGTGFDSTSAQQIDLFGTWSVASTSNSISMLQYSLDLVN